MTWSNFRTPTFVSEGSFLIKRGTEEIDVRSLDGEANARTPGVGGNVPHILLSTELLRRVVDKLGIVEDQAGAIEDLRSRLDIFVPRHSSLVQVSLEDIDAEYARDTLQVYMEEAIDHHLDVYRDSRGVAIVEQGHRTAVAALEAARTRHREFLEGTGTSEFAAELEARRTDLAEALRARQEFTREIEFGSSNEPRLVALREQLRTLETRLVDLRTKLQPSDRAIVSTERTITELRTRATEIAAEHAAFLKQHHKERIEAASRALAELAPLESRFQMLSQTLEKRQEQLERAENALERARHKQLLATNQVSSLAVLDKASMPISFDDLSPLALLLRGLGAGLALGIAFAVFRTMTDRRIHTVNDIETLGAPVLASIPNLTSKHINRHNEARMIG